MQVPLLKLEIKTGRLSPNAIAKTKYMQYLIFSNDVQNTADDK